MRGKKTSVKGIYRLGPELYQVSIWYKDPLTSRDVEKSKRVHGSFRAARDEQASMRTKWVRGEFSTTKGTFEEAIWEWLRLSQHSLGKNTYYNYKKALEIWVIPRLGQVKLKDLTTKDLDDLWTTMIQVRAAATVRKLKGTVTAVLDQAVTWGWLQVNPALACKKIRLIKQRPRVPESADVFHYLDWIHEQNPVYGRLFWLNFYLGDRLGETVGLRNSRIDWERCRVLLTESVSYVVGEGPVPKAVKTEEPHWVGLGEEGMKLLRDQRDYMLERARAAGISQDNIRDFYLWSDDIDGHSPWIPHRVSVRFARYRKKYPRGVDVTLRKLRHLNATVLLRNGMSLSDVSSRLGHANVKTTSDFYLDNTSSNDVLAASILDNIRSETSSEAK